MLSGCSLFRDYSGEVMYQADPRCSRPDETIREAWTSVVGAAKERGYLSDTGAVKYHDVCVSSEPTVDCGLGKPLYGCAHWKGWIVVAGGAKLFRCDWRCTLVHEFLNWLGPMTHSLKDWPDTEAESVADPRYAELKHVVIARWGFKE